MKEQTKKDNTVFVVNDSGHDISDLNHFGVIHTVTKGLIAKFKITQMVREFYPLVNASKPKDHIAVVGPTVMLIIFCAMFAVKHKRLNLLIIGNGRYLSRTVVFTGAMFDGTDSRDDKVQ